MAKILSQVLDYRGVNSVICECVERDDLDMRAQLIVPPTHCAIMVRGGVADTYVREPGTYPVFETRKVGLFRREITNEHVYTIFISKTALLTSNWGTNPPLNVVDPETSVAYQIGFHGSFDIFISNPMVFYTNVVGSASEFVLSDFADKLRSTVGMFVSSALNPQLGLYKYYEIDAHLLDLSLNLRDNLSNYLLGLYGIEIKKFEIARSFVSMEQRARLDNARREIANRKEAERNADDATNRRRDLYDLIREVGYPADGAVADLDDTLKCPGCGKKMSPGAKFCALCGRSVAPTPCPQCGKYVEAGASFCTYCGKKLN